MKTIVTTDLKPANDGEREFLAMRAQVKPEDYADVLRDLNEVLRDMDDLVRDATAIADAFDVGTMTAICNAELEPRSGRGASISISPRSD